LTQAKSEFTELDRLSAEKKKVLDADLAREKEKERLRLLFSHLASELTRFSKNTGEKLPLAHFGFNLAEVEAFKAVLDKTNTEILAEANKLKTEADQTYTAAVNLGVKENPYTTLTPADLAKTLEDLNAAIEKRNAAYQQELALQRANDALCKQFADVAEPLFKFLVDTKNKVNNSTAELEEQLKFVDERITKKDTESANLSQVHKLHAEIKGKNITQNRHTSLSAQDVQLQFDQYILFLSKKKQMLEEELEHKNLRGITKEEYKEIEDNFKIFDKDKSNNIDKRELRACLYSLGEEKTKTEIEAIMTKFGKDGKMSHELFKEFMIGVYGNNDSAEQIINGFKLINKGEAVASVPRLEHVMEDPDVKYITDNAPKKDNGYDYVQFTNTLFSR